MSQTNGDAMEGFDFVETVSGKTDGKFAGNGRMITVEDAVYAEAASALLEAIGDGYYYNGTVEVDGDGSIRLSRRR